MSLKGGVSFDVDADTPKSGMSRPRLASARPRAGGIGEISRPAPASKYSPAPEAKSLGIGDKVEADFKGHGKWHPGVVKRVRGGTFDIIYDDGQTESGVPPGRVRSYLSDPTDSPFAPSKLSEGDK
ncbi:hypothetical protein B484DRAFT_399026, partial [Ochromonadaceae sp. CCMP2298]